MTKSKKKEINKIDKDKKNKKPFWIKFLLILLAIISIYTILQPRYTNIVDNTNTLTTSQIKSLEKRTNNFLGYTFFFTLVDKVPSDKKVNEYNKEIFNNIDKLNKKKTISVLISKNDRKVNIYLGKKANEYLNGKKIVEEMSDYLKEGDYYNAINKSISLLKKVVVIHYAIAIITLIVIAILSLFEPFKNSTNGSKSYCDIDLDSSSDGGSYTSDF